MANSDASRPIPAGGDEIGELLCDTDEALLRIDAEVALAPDNQALRINADAIRKRHSVLLRRALTAAAIRSRSSNGGQG